MPKYDFINLFIDTEVFVRANFNLSSNGFERLFPYVASGQINLYLTTITIKEVYSHLEEKANDAYNSLTKFKRNSAILPRDKPPEFQVIYSTTKEELAKLFREKFDNFISSHKTEVISMNNVNSEKVFSDYFNERAPFDKGKKKNEFPDAFSLAAINEWCIRNGDNMFIVTEDKGWEPYCENSDHLQLYCQIYEVFSLLLDPEVVDSIEASLMCKEPELLKWISKEFPLLEFHLEGLEGDIYSISVDNAAVAEINVLEAEDGNALVSVDLMIVFQVDATYEEPSSYTIGSDEKPEPVSETIQDETKISIEIQLSYDEDAPTEIDIMQIYLPYEESIWVNPGEFGFY